MARPCECDNCTIGEPWKRHRDCRRCWLFWNDPRYRRLWSTPTPPGVTPRPAPAGPGTELKKLLAELGITDFAGCSCNAKAAQMNEWGIDGCRANFETIRGWVTEAQSKAGWLMKVNAAIRAAKIGFVFEIDPTDVAGSLVRIAIQRAASKYT